MSAHESDDGLSVTYLTRPYIMASAVIRGTSFSQAEVSFFEDYDKQCSNVDFFSVLLLQFCLEYRGSAHGSYYPEGLGVLFHREKRGGGGGWRPSTHYAQGSFFPEAPRLLRSRGEGLVSFRDLS